MTSIFPATGMPDDDWWHALWPDPVAVLKRLGFSETQRVIDLCCGNGLFSLALLHIGCQVEGLDCDQALLDQAAMNAVDAGYRNAVWHLGDARAIDRLIHPPADAVLIANTFHGIEDPTSFCQACQRALIPGGRLVIVNWHAKPRDETAVLDKPRGPRSEIRMSPDKVRAAVEPAGLALREVIELPPYHYGAVFIAR